MNKSQNATSPKCYTAGIQTALPQMVAPSASALSFLQLFLPLLLLHVAHHAVEPAVAIPAIHMHCVTYAIDMPCVTSAILMHCVTNVCIFS